MLYATYESVRAEQVDRQRNAALNRQALRAQRVHRTRLAAHRKRKPQKFPRQARPVWRPSALR